jgi:uncharacterized RDD family membrane protein YckC
MTGASAPRPSAVPGGWRPGVDAVTEATAGADAATVASETSGSPYAGLATRTLAFAVDAAVINGIALFVGIVVALGLSLLDLPHDVQVVLAAIGAALALVWTVSYFVVCWSATGQTPGNRLMEIRVQQTTTGRAVSPWRAFLRLLCLVLSAIPLCAGFLLVLVDRRRRALHDRLVRTEVVYAPARMPPGRGPGSR